MNMKKTSSNSFNVSLGVASALLIGCSVASAQTAATPPVRLARLADQAQEPKAAPVQTAAAPHTNHWETTAAAAVTLTRGNSESFLATISLDTKRKWERNEAALGLSGGYGDSKDRVTQVNTKNTEFAQGFGQYNHLFSDRFYVGLRVDAKYDGIAGVDYRCKISPLAGYYLIKTDKTRLSVEAGPGLVLEHLKNQEADSYWAARFGERFEHKLTATTKLWQSLDYFPQMEHWTKNYLMNFEAGIDTAINKHWSLRVVFQDMYASQPAQGWKDNDMRLLAGTAYKF